MSVDIYDEESIYCRKLGHHLKFNYCRRESGDLPCSVVAKCWLDKIPISDFLNEHFSAEELNKAFSPPTAKVTSLIDLIQKAQALNK
jgi:hypothetical protein